MQAAFGRTRAIRLAVGIELVAVLWMAAEAALAIGAGVVARSVLLTAFGFDSVIELLSAAVLAWRLSVEAAGSAPDRVDRVEAGTVRISAALLVLLSAYVATTSVAGLVLGVKPETSVLGIAVAAAAVGGMPLLALAKHRVNLKLGSPSLRADIAETITCAYMAAVTLAGVAAGGLLGWWWIQYLAALVLLAWLIPETREALEAARAGHPD
jgi:divalent metal cation (Fe/Co/Zn/Cd) transporter